MNRSRSKSRFGLLRKERSDQQNQGQIEWERVMVQITFACVIIIGYLVSVGVDETQDLAAETELQRRRNQILEALVTEFKGTDIGEARARMVAAERNLQLERLLRLWADLRVERRLYKLLRKFENAELIPLADDLRCLPTGEGFQELNGEADRVFLSGNEKISAPEVARLVETVLRRAGINPEAVPEADQMSSDMAAFLFEKNKATNENLKRLTLRVLGDVEKERNELAGLQYTLVGRVASARRDKLAGLSLEEESRLKTKGIDLGVAMLDEVLDDLRRGMKLLPETANHIRNGVRSASDSTPGALSPTEKAL